LNVPTFAGKPVIGFFGDADGVVVVPQAAASAIFAEALHKAESEDRTRRDLLAGRSLAEVYNQYGVL